MENVALFTDLEHETIQLVCDAFIGEVAPLDADRGYWRGKLSDLKLREKIELAAGKLPEDDIKDLKKLLRLCTRRELGLTWGGPLKQLKALNEKQRAKLLYKWSKSNIKDLRKAFNVFRKLSTFLYYSSDAQEITHVHQKIGYEGPLNTGVTSLTAIQIEQAREGDVVHCEYLIIGSGAGGGLAAEMLTEAGKDVVLLEKGQFLNETQFNEKEWDMITNLYDRGGALATKDASVTIFAGSCLGGGTTVNWNGSFQTPEYILEEWSLKHNLRQVTTSEYQKSFDWVKERFNVNAENSTHNFQNQMLWDGAEKLGLNPSVIARNVKGCKDSGLKKCGYCGFGCKAGCKQSTLKTTIRKAAENGAKVYCNAEAVKINFNGSKAKGADVIQLVDGVKRKYTVKANHVIVACGAIHTPSLLLRSGVGHPEIGRNLFLHPTVGIAGMYKEDSMPWQGAMMTTLVSNALQLDENYGYWIETPPVHLGVIGMTLPWVSIEQHKKDIAMAKHCGAFIVLTRDKHGGTVGIDRQGRASVKYKLHSYDLNHALKGMAEAAEIHIAAGAQEVLFPHRSRKAVSNEMSSTSRQQLYKGMTSWKWRPNDFILYSAHQMSTCRMGGDKKRHPVRPDGKLVGYKNIYVADGSALPSCPGINPMISIMAQSHFTINNLLNGE